MKELLVFGEKIFRITVPDDAKITFGPWSPPKEGGRGWADGSDPGGKRGTLRIYGKNKEDIVAVFAGVQGFRDLSLKYSEQVAKEEGATIWKDDEGGYEKSHTVRRKSQWVDPVPRLPRPVKPIKKVKK